MLFRSLADIFCLPSEYEASPLVVLEALACGVPVVATDVGGVRTLIEGASVGVVCDRDPLSVAGAVDTIARMLSDRRREVEEAAREVAELNSWAVVASRYLDEVRAAVSRRS